MGVNGYDEPEKHHLLQIKTSDCACDTAQIVL